MPFPRLSIPRPGSTAGVRLRHHDFPSILSEALDYLAGAELELSAVAKRLNVSSSQLVKLLRSFRPAFEYVNAEREKRNLGRLK